MIEIMESDKVKNSSSKETIGLDLVKVRSQKALLKDELSFHQLGLCQQKVEKVYDLLLKQAKTRRRRLRHITNNLQQQHHEKNQKLSTIHEDEDICSDQSSSSEDENDSFIIASRLLPPQSPSPDTFYPLLSSRRTCISSPLAHSSITNSNQSTTHFIPHHQQQRSIIINRRKRPLLPSRSQQRNNRKENHEPTQEMQGRGTNSPRTTLRQKQVYHQQTPSVAAPRLSNAAPKKKRVSKICCFKGCKNNNMNHLHFTRIQTKPKLPAKDASKARKNTYEIKVKRREEQLKRCGLSKNDERKDLRYCSLHDDDAAEVECKTTTNLKYTLKNLPSTKGISNKSHFSKASKPSKGNAYDRYASRCMDDISKSNPEAASWIQATQEAYERNTPNRAKVKINSTVKNKFNISSTPQSLDKNGNKKQKSRYNRQPKQKNHRSWLQQPKYQPFASMYGMKTKNQKKYQRLKKEHDRRVKRITGFQTEEDMLAFIIIVCNADIGMMTKTTKYSTLTWYEEWFVFLEKIWGRTSCRWIDAADKQDGYGIRCATLLSIFDEKMAQVVRCRSSWPEFASFEEDKKLCENDEMKGKYKDLRPIFWDMTSISMPKPSDATMQRLTYSPYYAANCFKGGIGLQQCGWIRVHDLWTGCVSDTKYQEESGIFEIQNKFCEKDLVDGKVIPFLNVFDKGYRNRLSAWRSGKQLTLQPVFSKSDLKFRRKDTLSSAVVASDRSSNERAVRLSKMSSYLHDGLHPHQSMIRMHHAWLCWSFQVNFMFDAVL